MRATATQCHLESLKKNAASLLDLSVPLVPFAPLCPLALESDSGERLDRLQS